MWETRKISAANFGQWGIWFLIVWWRSSTNFGCIPKRKLRSLRPYVREEEGGRRREWKKEGDGKRGSEEGLEEEKEKEIVSPWLLTKLPNIKMGIKWKYVYFQVRCSSYTLSWERRWRAHYQPLQLWGKVAVLCMRVACTWGSRHWGPRSLAGGRPGALTTPSSHR